MLELNIMSKEEFVPATITLRGSFSVSVDINNLANFLPITNIFDDEGKRLFLVSGCRESIKYFGVEGSVVSLCYCKIRRGMRTGAMHNMVSADIQYNFKNIHIKISSSSITSVGATSMEIGNKVFAKMTEHIINLQEDLNIINEISKEEKIKTIDWLSGICHKNGIILRYNEIIPLVEKIEDNFFLHHCIKYINDFDDKDKFIQKLNLFLEPINIYSGDLKCGNSIIFNSVYHIKPIKQKNFRMPVHRLSAFLANKGLTPDYHNWSSEGANLCLPVEEEKGDLNHDDREYRHRFSIHVTTKIKQCSPSNKDEAYRNYLGVMKLIEEFFENPNIDFSKYITEEKNHKAIKDLKILGK